MKNLTLLIFFTLHISLFTFHLSSQPCLPEGIEFTTQSQIDNFQINYPNCTEIEGDVHIAYMTVTDITNLDGLSVLTSIGGNLWIGSYYINAIPGGLGCWGNPFLDDITGLNNLTYIGGVLGIFCNDALTNLSGLENLTTIGGSLRIGFAMEDITGVQLAGNPSLINITGLEAVSSIGGDLEIQGNVSLLSLTGLGNIDANSIENITIKLNNSLTTCEVQSICNYVAPPNGTVEIHDNAPGCNSLEEVEEACGFNCLPEGIHFTTQAEIDNFQINYPNCTEIEGNVIISGEDIFDLSGLSLLKSVTELLEISNTVNLTSLSGLQNLNFISGVFYDGGILRIINNDLLINLNGLEGLTQLGTGPSTGSRLEIHNNHMLISLSGIENIESNSIQELSFQNNPSLANCDVQSICDYFAIPYANVVIENNATGCNNQQEVEDACAQSVNEISNISNLSIHPNPFSNKTTIEFELRQPDIVTITIYNHLGEQLEVINEKKSVGHQMIEWDCEELPAGVYFCVLKTDKAIQTTKMIKL